MDRAARYTFLVYLADQMRQVLERNPVGDPTANRIVSPAVTSRAGVAFGTSLMTSMLMIFVHRVMANERCVISLQPRVTGRNGIEPPTLRFSAG